MSTVLPPVSSPRSARNAGTASDNNNSGSGTRRRRHVQQQQSNHQQQLPTSIRSAAQQWLDEYAAHSNASPNTPRKLALHNMPPHDFVDPLETRPAQVWALQPMQPTSSAPAYRIPKAGSAVEQYNTGNNNTVVIVGGGGGGTAGEHHEQRNNNGNKALSLSRLEHSPLATTVVNSARTTMAMKRKGTSNGSDNKTKHRRASPKSTSNSLSPNKNEQEQQQPHKQENSQNSENSDKPRLTEEQLERFRRSLHLDQYDTSATLSADSKACGAVAPAREDF